MWLLTSKVPLPLKDSLLIFGTIFVNSQSAVVNYTGFL